MAGVYARVDKRPEKLGTTGVGTATVAGAGSTWTITNAGLNVDWEGSGQTALRYTSADPRALAGAARLR